MTYPYITHNNLQEKQHYMYSQYQGMDFLKDYLKSRACRHWPTEDAPRPSITATGSPVQQELMVVYEILKDKHWNQDMHHTVNAYIKSFEVRKRLYTEYDLNWKPVQGAGFEEFDSYLLLADCLLLAYKETGCLKYFSCLLKLDDTLLSIQNKLGAGQKSWLYQVVGEEVKLVDQLAREVGITMEENQVCD